MKMLKEKWNGILYDGGFDDFSVNGDLYMEEEVSYKNNPGIEGRKRMDMAYLLLNNPQMVETIQKSKAHFFHGTNANALFNILKYGIYSEKKSFDNNIDVVTGEEWSRRDVKRNFVSLTDCLDIALRYANMQPTDVEAQKNELLNFGVVIGVSLESMEGITAFGVDSDISEVGVLGSVPIDNIKFLAVPDDKVEFVKKMIGNKKIEVVSMQIEDRFFNAVTNVEKLQMLELARDKEELPQVSYQTYSKEDVETTIKGRKTSGIRKIFEELKEKLTYTKDKKMNERS